MEAVLKREILGILIAWFMLKLISPASWGMVAYSHLGHWHVLWAISNVLEHSPLFLDFWPIFLVQECLCHRRPARLLWLYYPFITRSLCSWLSASFSQTFLCLLTMHILGFHFSIIPSQLLFFFGISPYFFMFHHWLSIYFVLLVDVINWFIIVYVLNDC